MIKPQLDKMTGKSKAAGLPRGRVLVVDDDPILRDVMCAQLGELGYKSTQAENGEEAAAALEREPLKLAIIDISMPKLDGFGLLRHIRQNTRNADLPVIVCTSHNDQSSIDQAYDLGASSFVTKPINWPQFAHHVQFIVRSGEIERDMREAQQDAIATSRMKNGLFHVLSHELKTPLTALIGLTGVLGESLRSKIDSGEAEQLGHVVDAARRLNTIVSDILLLSKALANPAQRNLPSVAIGEILDDALVGHRALAKEREVRLLQRPLERDFTVACDAHLIRQAVSKLVDNAVKFSPAGSTVEVWAYGKADGSAVVSVRDQGPGLTQAKLKECLKPFVQEDMSYARPIDGLGLGLPIAKAICEAHGGELIVQTAPGQGLVAAISLPPRGIFKQAGTG